MIKYIVACLLLLHASVENTTAQRHRTACIDGYMYIGEGQYFDQYNRKTMAELKTLDSTYDFYVSFRIDTTGHIIDFIIEEIPVRRMPEVAVSYIRVGLFIALSIALIPLCAKLLGLKAA